VYRNKRGGNQMVELPTAPVVRIIAVRRNSYAPYSNFHVGAAVLMEDGEIFVGANVENISYGLTNCAERSAIFNAISYGKRKIKAIAIATNDDRPIPPCGACRQVIREFSDAGTLIIMVGSTGVYETKTIDELLPFNFGN
jgi:cytidine deaminase